MTSPRLAVLGLSIASLVCAGMVAGPAQAKSGTADRFKACTRSVAAKTTTNLRPVPSIHAGNDHNAAVGIIPHGVVRLEHATDLSLTDGRIGAGNGFDAATGGIAPVRVSHAAVVAPVTLVVLDSKTSGRRVALVEVRIKPATPVRWQFSNSLSIVTDGGDGGFSRGTAPDVASGLESVTDGYVNAFFPHENSDAGNVCVLRLAKKGDADAVLFLTGYGDGGYPTFVGKDKTGAVVSIVSYDWVLPWSFAGLPGTAPKYDFTP